MKKEKTVKIKLPRVSGNNDSVFVSVGELSYRIKRGVSVEVPYCIYDVLRMSEAAEDRATAFIEANH